jgi:hypothetical protein
MADRAGTTFSGPVEPDELTPAEDALNAALAWLRQLDPPSQAIT